ncbi:hypothetical protein FTX61_00690 [Nitriliruptoraceae bacterium ZYF776]|nr:hypothetical protein [Profundirhabdus halotolerans]
MTAPLTRADGSSTDLGWAVGRTVQDPRVRFHVRRLQAGRADQVTVHAGDVVVVGGDPRSGDGAVVAPPDALARTLLEVLDLPVVVPTDARRPVTTDAPLAPFLAGPDGTWAADVGADAARLLRIEIAAGERHTAVVLADLGRGGVWAADPDGGAEGDPRRWRPTSPSEVLRELAALPPRPPGPRAPRWVEGAPRVAVADDLQVPVPVA